MQRLQPETVKLLAREIFGYELTDHSASTVAHMIGALSTYSHRMEALTPEGVQPPVSYPVILAEAQRIRSLR